MVLEIIVDGKWSLILVSDMVINEALGQNAMQKPKLSKSIEHDKRLAIKKTSIEGFGIFANKAFKKGEIVFVADGAVIDDTDKRLSHRGIQVSHHRFIEPKRFSFGWSLNHSCSPNSYVDWSKIVAKRAIKKGEEITTDYSLFTNYPTWEMDCRCGSKNCRRLIKPFRHLQGCFDKNYVSGYLR